MVHFFIVIIGFVWQTIVAIWYFLLPNNQDPAQAAQIRANTLDEIIRATSEAFLGMTLGCARCHDHKFDPITQQDYYGLYATFSGIRHGAVELATPEDKASRDTTAIAASRLASHQASWFLVSARVSFCDKKGSGIVTCQRKMSQLFCNNDNWFTAIQQ